MLIATLPVNGYYAYTIFGGNVADTKNYQGMSDEQIALQQEREARKQAQEEAEYMGKASDSAKTKLEALSALDQIDGNKS